ncbi:MAG TPA: alpha/beta hydrolase-fold protein [Chthoniobacteraceae bacterium]|jgi:enterochelin esterase family protein|nr:alpha/beta hydrolase-fold protein [Chthoniobacteraceae bacterium]
MTGKTHEHEYHSVVTGARRRLRVYTPPGYETESAAAYPVLYLLHGRGGGVDTWLREGRANLIMDALLAEGRARPMVLAMPDGHFFGTDWKERRDTKIRAFATDLYQCVIPEVERLYRVGREGKDRALAGLSMGGGQTISAGMARPEMFGAFGIFSAGLWPEVTPLVEPALPQLRATPPHPLWVGIGRNDQLYGHCVKLRRMLEAAGVPFTYHEDDTGHTWDAWRDYLERFAPLLFRAP